MPAYKGSPGGGGGSGGLTLGPPTNEFTAATKAAAETLRNAYATANATWLADYDDEPTYTITINWPATPTNTVFQARRSSSWADVTGLVRGPKGIAGDQARFEVYAYINTATAPAVAPTGGTFVQTTGTLTVPTGYTSVPSTPASGSKTYRTAAVVNPANDTDTVTLTWALPAELPAYAAATVAEDAADRAAASATAAAGDAALVESYSGPAAILDDVAFESNNADFTVTGWREYDFLQVVLRDSDATTQFTRPASLIDTVTLDSIGEARAAVNNNDEVRLLRTAGSDVLSLNINGWSGHPTTGDVVTFLGIRAGVQGGGGGGGSEDTDLTIGSRGATTLDVESSTGDDATLPAATTALSGLMAAADKTALNNAGGQHRFGAVDPVATDGNNKDAWVNTADGTLWVKAAGAWTKQYTFPAGGSGPAPTHTGQYLAGKATSTFVATDFTGTAGVEYASGEHTATMPTVTGNVYAGVARLATDPDPTFADVNGTGLNQFADFTQQTGTVTIGGAAHNVWVSDFAVFATGDEVEFR